MRKPNDKTMKQAIEQMMNVYKIKRRFDETGIIAAWPDIVGKPVANRTSELFISNKKMFLRIESSIVKNELLMMRSQIIEKINAEAGGDKLVEEIIFL
jgi:predicted nucleic acid-binding Zn ribbon protein